MLKRDVKLQLTNFGFEGLAEPGVNPKIGWLKRTESSSGGGGGHWSSLSLSSCHCIYVV